jgi:4-hydroxy-4-methyl-2-oxoglutarate aldolase
MGDVGTSEYILREDFPVFARHTTPEDCVPRWELVDYNIAVTVGNVRIRPGDYIVTDHDGIVAIPHEVIDSVLEDAEAVLATESEVRSAVREGMLPLEAYDRFGMF